MRLDDAVVLTAVAAAHAHVVVVAVVQTATWKPLGLLVGQVSLLKTLASAQMCMHEVI